MSDRSPADPETGTVLKALADPECRTILAELDRPRSAPEVIERCGLSQTNTYRKLESLSEARLVEEGTELRPDGHHVTTYERAATGVVVLLEDADFACEVVREPTSADRRLARFWSRISEEL